MSDTFFCSDYSRDAGEALFGTVTTTATWFLLEYNGRWERTAFESSDLPAPVKERLQAHLAAIPQSKIQVIRQNPRLAPEGIALFVARTTESDPALYAFSLERYEDLLDLDLPAIAAGDAAHDGARRAEPLFIVCTHGRRDKCCARRGAPVYERVAQEVGAAVWQTSHIGGHRLGANVICFPHGIVYGHGSPENAPGIVAAYRAGRLVPDLYRGRACYPPVAQVAEYFLRAETGIEELDAFRLTGVENSGDHQWTVHFAGRSDTRILRIEEDPAGWPVYASCDDADLSPQPKFRLLSHDAVQS
jgi:hypothetical protein